MKYYIPFFLFLFLVSSALAEEGLIARWTFDEGDGNVYSCATDSRWDARSAQPVERVEGVFGKALKLTGGNPVSVPAGVMGTVHKELSFVAWVAPQATPDRYNEILRKEDGENRFLFSFQEHFTVLSLGLNVNGYYECDAPISPEDVQDGKWHLVAGTFDGKKMKVWLDGLLIASEKREGELNSTSHPSTGNYNHWAFNPDEYREAMKNAASAPAVAPSVAKVPEGAPVYLGSDQNKEYFAGKLDDVRIYSRALSQEEIQAMYREGTGLEPRKSLTKTQPVTSETLLRQYTEYLPVTEMQWSVLSDAERAKWERVREVKGLMEAYMKDPTTLAPEKAAELTREMASQVAERPRVQEAVAQYRPAETPAVVDLTAEQAEEALRKEWLFQCGGNITQEVLQKEIQWTRDLAARIRGVDFSARLETLEKIAKNPGKLEDDYFAVRKIKREIMFANPVLDFSSVLFVDGPYPEGREWAHETRHRQGYEAVPGGRLMILNGLGPNGKQTQLMPQAPLHGAFWRPDLSFDGKKVLFCYEPHNEKAFHLYEIGIDGTGLRQLTGGMFDDLDPIYLPDGKHIMFLTTRGHLYVRCMPPTNAMVMARMELGSKECYIVSRNGEPEYLPSVLADGRVIYTRWEYTDKPLWRAQSLWTMNADGTQVQTFWGNQSVWPDLLKDARQIPGSERVMFTGSAHHNWFSGSVGIIDPRKGFNFPDGLTKVTADVGWPESGNGPIDPIESANYHPEGKYTAYYSPYPLSEKDFLVSACRDGKFVLLLMDTDGNRELVWEGHFNVFHAIPVRPRAVPRVAPDLVDWPTWENRANPSTGVIYSNNIYENTPEELHGKAKFLRILSIEHKTYTQWNERPYASTGPVVSMVQSEGIKRVLGTVPVEDDGSVNFIAPAGVALHFQLLDENHRALQTMRSFTGVMPGESRGCLGCHESRVRTPIRMTAGKALLRAPSEIQPVPWTDISVSWGRYVQPTLDKYCGKCHQDPKGDAYKALNMTLRPGYGPFPEPYVTLVGGPTWAHPYTTPKDLPPGWGWADTIQVESYSTVDPKAYQTVPPMTRLSYKSRLVDRMASGNHHGVKVEGEDLLRVILWVDTMCPLKGAEEVREMPDPEFQGVDWIAIRPRIQTAPIVQRPGPFDAFHTDTDPAYSAPEAEDLNKLPPGIHR